MQKRVIKDIQVRKKTANNHTPVNPAPRVVTRDFEIPNKVINRPPERKPDIVKPAASVKENFIVQNDMGSFGVSGNFTSPNTKRRGDEVVKTTEFSPFEDQIYSYKPKKSINRKTRILTVMLVIGLFLIMGLVYIITGTHIKITPKIVDTPINESITPRSWTVPFKTTIMVIEESSDITESGEDETKKVLDEKIKNRIKFDMPMGYTLIPGCKTSTYYETITKEAGAKSIKAKVTSLVIEESDLRKYLIESNKLSKLDIKNIFSLTCELKTDITKYSVGDKTNNLAFVLSGKIKTEYIIETEDVESNTLGKSKNNARKYLDSQEGILDYEIKSRPLNFIPVIPKNGDHLHILIESTL